MFQVSDREIAYLNRVVAYIDPGLNPTLHDDVVGLLESIDPDAAAKELEEALKAQNDENTVALEGMEAERDAAIERAERAEELLAEIEGGASVASLFDKVRAETQQLVDRYNKLVATVQASKSKRRK